MTRVEALIRPTVNIYGGLSISSGCTSGFSVKSASGVKGVTTAGHCLNTYSYSGITLPFQHQTVSGAYDSQWNSAPGFTVLNRVWDGIQDATPNYRNITSRIARANQAIGSWVCKYGRSTHYGCGTLINKTIAPSYLPNAAPVFLQVTGNGVNLADGGDSGGPVFYASAAWGMIVAENCLITCNDMIYTAADYMEAGAGGITVLTQ